MRQTFMYHIELYITMISENFILKQRLKLNIKPINNDILKNDIFHFVLS